MLPGDVFGSGLPTLLLGKRQKVSASEIGTSLQDSQSRSTRPPQRAQFWPWNSRLENQHLEKAPGGRHEIQLQLGVAWVTTWADLV